jgi:hypothetical protein
MFERYSARARSVIFLALGCARRRGAAYIEPEDILHALVREDGETSLPPQNCLLAPPAPTEWLGSDHPPLFPDEVAEELLRALEDPPKGDPAAKDDMPVSRSLKQALASAANIAQERDSRTIEPLRLLAARQSLRNGEAPGSRHWV